MLHLAATDPCHLPEEAELCVFSKTRPKLWPTLSMRRPRFQFTFWDMYSLLDLSVLYFHLWTELELFLPPRINCVQFCDISRVSRFVSSCGSSSWSYSTEFLSRLFTPRSWSLKTDSCCASLDLRWGDCLVAGAVCCELHRTFIPSWSCTEPLRRKRCVVDLFNTLCNGDVSTSILQRVFAVVEACADITLFHFPNLFVKKRDLSCCRQFFWHFKVCKNFTVHFKTQNFVHSSLDANHLDHPENVFICCGALCASAKFSRASASQNCILRTTNSAIFCWSVCFSRRDLARGIGTENARMWICFEITHFVVFLWGLLSRQAKWTWLGVGGLFWSSVCRCWIPKCQIANSLYVQLVYDKRNTVRRREHCSADPSPPPTIPLSPKHLSFVVRNLAKSVVTNSVRALEKWKTFTQTQNTLLFPRPQLLEGWIFIFTEKKESSQIPPETHLLQTVEIWFKILWIFSLRWPSPPRNERKFALQSELPQNPRGTWQRWQVFLSEFCWGFVSHPVWFWREVDNRTIFQTGGNVEEIPFRILEQNRRKMVRIIRCMDCSSVSPNCDSSWTQRYLSVGK